jgi:AraC-like DNA-binding protein
MRRQWDDFVPSINYLVARRCTPEWRLRPHAVSEYDITYVTKGNAEYGVNGNRYTLSPGDLLCLSKGAIKEARTWSDRLMRCFSVNYSRTHGAAPYFPEISHIGVNRDLINLFNELNFAWTERRDGYIVKTRGLLLLILHQLYELTTTPDPSEEDYRVKKACQYIAEHYAEKLPVKKLAGLANLNAVYFGALFKRETGLTVQQYIARTRVRHAENMLKSGEYKVQKTAELCGYQDVFHFYKQFKTLTGFPPSRCIPKR